MAASFADLMKSSKKDLTGSVRFNISAVRGRLPNMLSTGSIFLDYKFNGGLLQSSFQQLFGPTGAGKSTMAYRLLAANQNVAVELLPQGMGSLPNFLPHLAYTKVVKRPVIICDAEGGVNEEFLGSCGVDYNRPDFGIFTPENGEDWFHYYKRVCRDYYASFVDAGKVSEEYIPPISVIDSLAALVPASVLEDEQRQIAYLARLMSDFLPINIAINAKTHATTLAINQVRINPMQMMGNPETTKGGQTPHFLASGNFRISRTGQNEDLTDSFSSERARAYTLKISPRKCRWAPITGDAYEILTFMGKGYSRMSDMWNFGIATGQIKQNGAWYQLEVIGRPDLNITKNVRGDDLKKYLREKNLWETFVKQLFCGAAWANGPLDAVQLNWLKVEESGAAPDVVSEEEEAEAVARLEEVRQVEKNAEAASGVGGLL